MDINVARTVLQGGLQAVSKAVSTKPTIEAIKNVAIEAKNNVIKLSATDLEISISTVIGAEVVKPGSLTVSAKTLIDFINLIQEDNVHIYLDGNELKVETDSTKSKFPIIPIEEFPVLPDISKNAKLWTKIDRNEFINVIDKVTFSAEQNGKQPIFSGVYMHMIGSKLAFIATDSFRLSKYELTPREIKNNEFKAVVPHMSMDILAKLVSEAVDAEDAEDADVNEEIEVYLVSKDNQILFNLGRTELVSNLLDDSYPDYKAIIPDSYINIYEVDRNQLIDAVKLSLIFYAKQEGSRIHLEKSLEDEKLILKSSSADYGQYEKKLAMKIDLENVALEADFSPRHFLEILSKIKSESVILNVVEHVRNNKQILILNEKDNEDFLHLLTSLTGV